MAEIEDPARYLSYLEQCLSSDKRPLGLFLGAGCPMSVEADDGPLIPDVAGLTRIVRQQLAADSELEPLLGLIDRHFEEDHQEDADVEAMLTHIRALQAIAGNADARGLSGKQLAKLDDAICSFIHEVADRVLPDRATPYHQLAQWVDAVRRENPVEIFTTNYDLLMEQALEASRVPYFDGFAGVRKPFFDLRAMEEDMLPPRWARLWKLHGSINWYQVPQKGVFRSTAEEAAAAKRVIYPSHLKYEESRRMPYLAMIDRLRAFLRQPAAVLVLCGHSFRDQHINEVVIQGLESNLGAVCFALLFCALDGYPTATSLAAGRANLNLLARDGAVVSTGRVTWPEREADLVPNDVDLGVRWVPSDPDTDDGSWGAEFTLGDFATFGHLLEGLVGKAHRSVGAPSVK